MKTTLNSEAVYEAALSCLARPQYCERVIRGGIDERDLDTHREMIEGADYVIEENPHRLETARKLFELAVNLRAHEDTVELAREAAGQSGRPAPNMSVN